MPETHFDQQRLFSRREGPRAARACHGPWTIFAVVDGEESNQAARALASGATGLVVTSPQPIRQLHELELHKFAIRNEGGNLCGEKLLRLVGSTAIDPARLNISFAVDDVELTKQLAKANLCGPFAEADGRDVCASGGSIAEELAHGVATAVRHFRLLEFLNEMQLGNAVSVALAADQNMFPTMAKFRAMRILWDRVLDTVGLPPSPLLLHGETARLLMRGGDLPSYMLRATAAVIGAGLGSANSFSVLPFATRNFEHRMAINTQLILQHESQLWRVDDPAAGAGYVESLTLQYCEQAWGLFQKKERGA
jgi:methylmalonyl-CoA mutase